MCNLPANNKRNIYLSLFIVLIITCTAFIPSLDNSFVNWDDDVYVTENNLIKELSFKKTKEIFSSYCSGNYHPLTILSYSVENYYFGLNPKVFHVTNLIIHLFNCALVFWLIYLMTNNLTVCIVTSLFFGIHPMRVETVAWVSDRKDLLLCLFFTGSIISYIYYSRKKTASFYLLSFLFFLLALLSKTVGVTLPLVLFLMDYFFNRKFEIKMILEKTPFFCGSFLFGLIAIAARSSYQGELHESLIDFTLFEALPTGMYRLVFYYLLRIPAPVNISSFYPNSFGTDVMPESYLLFSSATILLSITGLILFSAKKTKKTVWGSLFFIITLLPVFKVYNLGISADRFSYVPLIGIFYLAGEAFAFLYKKTETRPFLITALLIITFLFSAATWNRCHIWKNSLTLINHAIKSYPNIPSLHFRRGNIFFINENYKNAITDYNRTIELSPGHSEAYLYRGLSYGKTGKNSLAVSDFTKALARDPDKIEAYLYRSFAYYIKKDFNHAWGDIIKAEALGGQVNPEFIKLLEKHSKRPETSGPKTYPQ